MTLIICTMYEEDTLDGGFPARRKCGVSVDNALGLLFQILYLLRDKHERHSISREALQAQKFIAILTRIFIFGSRHILS